MQSISDAIEAFIIQTLGDGNTLSISRNELAAFFAVAPSQVTYVLATRFTPDRGFILESRRGGGGSVTVSRAALDRDALLTELMTLPLSEGLSYGRAVHIIERLEGNGLLSADAADILKTAVSDKALAAPAMAKDGLRAGILRAVAGELSKRG